MMRDLSVALQQQGVDVEAKRQGDGINKQPQLSNPAGRNSSSCHCDAKRSAAYQAHRNPDSVVAAPRYQW